MALLAGCVAVALQLADARTQARRQTQILVDNSTDQLEKRLRHAVAITDALAATAAVAHPSLDHRDFDSYASRQAHLLGQLQSLQWSPDGVLRYQFPHRDGPQIGLDLIADPRNRSLSRLALQSRQTVVQGPFLLRQGGQGLVVRRASFAPGSQRFLGFAGVLLNWDAQMGELQSSANQGSWRLAFAVKDSLGVIHRSANWAELRRARPLSDRFKLLGAEWELLAVPLWRWQEQLLPCLLLFVSVTAGTLLAGSWLRLRFQSQQLLQAALRDQNLLFDALFQQSPDPVLLFDASAACIRSNPAARQLLVAPAARLELSTVAGGDPQLDVQRCLEEGRLETEWNLLLPAASQLLSWVVNLSRVDLGTGPLVIASLLDVTQLRHQQTQLTQLAEKYRALFEQSLDAVTLMDTQANLLEANEAAAKLHGLPDVQAYLAITPLDFSPEQQPNGMSTAERAVQVIELALRDGHCEFEWLHRRMDSGELWLGLVSLRRVELSQGPLLMVRVRDISESRRYEDRLRSLAYEDPLTGLPNRAATLDWLQKRCQRNPPQPLALLQLDLDGFQQVNDSFGDATGDQLLRCVADGLRTITSSVSHAWLARLESDSFAIALPGLDAAPIRSFVASLQERLALATAHREDLPVRMTVCVGVALAESAHGWDPHQLLQQANTALTQARRRGSGRLAFYDPAVSLAIERRLVLEQLLEQALQAPTPPFQLLYQAKVGPQAELLGAEALLRWPRPDGGVLPPLEFIPLSERTGQIHALGNWVLNEACRQLARWRERQLPLPLISINISAVQFEPHPAWPPLLEQLLAAVRSHQLEPGLLELEITETALLRTDADVVEHLDQLVQAGFQIAIDDFGTGFASLQMLKRYPLRVLKIDKSFVDGITTDPQDQAIVRGTLLMARRMGVHTVAEGVEHKAQWELLREMGCGMFQGYLFSQPLPADEFRARFLEARPTAP